MPYRVEHRGNQHVVVDGAGKDCGTHSSRKAAVEAIEALGRQSKVAPVSAAHDAKTVSRSSAYRTVAGDPVLRALKSFLPRKGEIERNTQRSYQEALNRLSGSISFASSSAQIHAELRKSPGQRRTAGAAGAKRKQGDATKRKVLALKAKGLRQVDIAKRLKITARQVREHLKGER